MDSGPQACRSGHLRIDDAAHLRPDSICGSNTGTSPACLVPAFAFARELKAPSLNLHIGALRPILQRINISKSEHGNKDHLHQTQHNPARHSHSVLGLSSIPSISRILFHPCSNPETSRSRPKQRSHCVNLLINPACRDRHRVAHRQSLRFQMGRLAQNC